MLSKKGHYVDKKSLKSICHSVSDSYLSYASLAWAQNSSSVSESYIYNKRFVNQVCLTVPCQCTETFGRYSLSIIVIYFRNNFQNKYQRTSIYLLKTKLRKRVDY